MNKGPPLFSSFRKKSKEQLTKDYPLDHKFSISTTRVSGLALRSTATNKDGVSTVDIGAVYKSKSTSIGVKVDELSNITLTLALKKIQPLTNIVGSFNLHDFESGKTATALTFKEIAPSTNAIASFKLPDVRSSKVGVAFTREHNPFGTSNVCNLGVMVFSLVQLKLQYFHHHATLTSTIALNQAPKIGVSATIGSPTIAMGAKATYEIFSSKYINFAVGINFNRPDSTASLVLGDNGDTIRALYRYRFDVLKKTAAAVEVTRRLSANETDFVVGGCYVFDDQTVVKGKLDGCGKLGAVLQRKIIPRSLVSISSELDIKALHKTPKFGLALAFKP